MLGVALAAGCGTSPVGIDSAVTVEAVTAKKGNRPPKANPPDEITVSVPPDPIFVPIDEEWIGVLGPPRQSP